MPGLGPLVAVIVPVARRFKDSLEIEWDHSARSVISIRPPSLTARTTCVGSANSTGPAYGKAVGGPPWRVAFSLHPRPVSLRALEGRFADQNFATLRSPSTVASRSGRPAGV